MSEHDPALDSAGRLDRYLADTIAELKPKPMPNKFTELAEKVARSRKAMDDRADRLSDRLDKLNGKADEAFSKHETHLDQAETGLDAMEEALSGLIGHNGPNG
jgi:hypothetical protein